MPAEPDFAALGLLEGLDGDAARARLTLLNDLHADGVPLDELKRAVSERRLALLPAERVLGMGARLSLRELAEETGLTIEFLIAHQRAVGLAVPDDPDEPALGEVTLRAAQSLARFRALGVPDEVMIEAARIFGESAGRAAGAVRTSVGAAFWQEGDSEHDVAMRLGAVARTLNDDAAALLGNLYRLHLLDQVRSDVIQQSGSEVTGLGAPRRVGVAFADLVGFTRLGQGVDADDLGTIAGRLAALAAQAADPPVRLVKTIGDAAMFVAPEPGPLLDAMHRLLELIAGEGDEFPQLRVGVDLGDAVGRWGDYYGSAVNVASRVTGVARPDSVLATQTVQEACADDYRWSFAGARRLKGVDGAVALFRCRPLEAGG